MAAASHTNTIKQRLLGVIQQLRQGLDASLPNRCLLCQQPLAQQRGLCAICLADGDPGPLCLCCTAPLPSHSQLSRCGKCLSRQRWRPLQVAVHYQSPAGQLVAQMKIQQRFAALTPLCQQLAKRMQTQPLPQVLVPIPMDHQRLRQRGSNHALRIALELGRQLQLSVRPELLIKVGHSDTQHLLSGRERRANLKRGFVAPAQPAQAGIGLVDDIVTTGTTLAVAASTLQRQGHRVSHYLALATAMN